MTTSNCAAILRPVKFWQLSNGASIEAIAAFLMLAVVAASVWWHNTANLEPRLAVSGFSPTYFVAEHEHPDWFASGYPSGAEEFLKSAPMLVYLLSSYARISVLAIMRAMIAAELIFLVAATAWTVRALRPDASYAGVWIACVFIIAGHLLEGDLGRWGHPVYGWTYNFAYAGVMVGAAAALTRRMLIASIAFAFAISSHAILGLLGVAFAATAFLIDWRSYSFRQSIAAIAVFSIAGGGWLIYIVATSAVSGGGIPDPLFVAVTRAMSFHWYPIETGLFWERHWERLYPFFAIALLLAVHLPDVSGMLSGRNLQAAAGFGALLALTVVGVLIPEIVTKPFLIKLAAQRASSIFLVLALPYVMAGTWRDIREGSTFRAGAAILILVMPFYVPAGIPLALAVFIALRALAQDWYVFGATHRVILLSTGVIIVAIFAICFWIAGVALSWSAPSYTGLDTVTVRDRWVLLVLLCTILLFRRRTVIPWFVLITMVGWLGATWSIGMDEMRDATRREEALAYMQAQIWAHDYTPPGTLFMPDPAHYYGWREFSLRPSFGNMREWLHSGWLYNSNAKYFFEGVARAHSLGVDANSLVTQSSSRPLERSFEMTTRVRARYYSLQPRDLVEFHRRFGVAYFVFAKKFLTGALPGNIVYQNAHYIILEPPSE